MTNRQRTVTTMLAVKNMIEALTSELPGAE